MSCWDNLLTDNYHSLKARWIVAEHLASREVARWIFFHYSIICFSIIIIIIHMKWAEQLSISSFVEKKNIQSWFDISKCEFAMAILFCLDHALFTPYGVNNGQFLWHSEPIRLLETPWSPIEYILIFINNNPSQAQLPPTWLSNSMKIKCTWISSLAIFVSSTCAKSQFWFSSLLELPFGNHQNYKNNLLEAHERAYHVAFVLWVPRI